MVRARPDDDSSNAFSIDDDEDMDQLLQEAANAGSAAAEIDTVGFEDFNMDEPATSAKPAAEVDFGIAFDEPVTRRPAPIEEPEAVLAPEFFEPVEEVGVGDEIDKLLQTIEIQRVAEAPVAQEEPEPFLEPEPEPVYVPPVYVPEPTPEPVYVAPEPAYVAPAPEPVRQPAPEPVAQPEPVKPSPTLAPTPKSLTLADQIALSQKIVATVDVYRSLTSEARDVVAQLLAPTADDFTLDEGTVAIRAIYADAIQESTQKALIEAKAATPVDRVFYVLGLPKDVLRFLGELVQAYSGTELPSDASDLQFAKALVEGIEGLNREPIVYAEAMAKVLAAAQQN